MLASHRRHCWACETQLEEGGERASLITCYCTFKLVLRITYMFELAISFTSLSLDHFSTSVAPSLRLSLGTDRQSDCIGAESGEVNLCTQSCQAYTQASSTTRSPSAAAGSSLSGGVVTSSRWRCVLCAAGFQCSHALGDSKLTWRCCLCLVFL